MIESHYPHQLDRGCDHHCWNAFMTDHWIVKSKLRIKYTIKLHENMLKIRCSDGSRTNGTGLKEQLEISLTNSINLGTIWWIISLFIHIWYVYVYMNGSWFSSHIQSSAHVNIKTVSTRQEPYTDRSISLVSSRLLIEVSLQNLLRRTQTTHPPLTSSSASSSMTSYNRQFPVSAWLIPACLSWQNQRLNFQLRRSNWNAVLTKRQLQWFLVEVLHKVLAHTVVALHQSYGWFIISRDRSGLMSPSRSQCLDSVKIITLSTV